MKNVEIVLPEDIENVNDIDLAINIHTWPECTRAEINDWLDFLVRKNVKHLFVVPHDGGMVCMDDWKSFLPDVEEHGYKVVKDDLLRNYFLFERNV